MSPQAALQAQLTERRKRLESVIGEIGGTAHLVGLLHEVDAALERIDNGSYGLCDACHDSIEVDRLLADPLVRLCLDHLTDDQRRALELDLELASRIQAALLPKQDLALDGWEAHLLYEPAGPVSGDYCDGVLPEGARSDLFLLLGDVSGKGVAASILMAHLHAILRPLIMSLPLVEAIERANRVFCESTLPMSYATLVAVRASASGIVQICNAGHCPPLVVHGSEVTSVPASGVPVGLFSSGNYAQREAHLVPGDLVVLYTDGLTEAANPDGDEYGIERLDRLLRKITRSSAAAAARACREDARAFQSGEPNRDDLTLMVLRRAG
jgi:sigma-B regulation protein RsbU (phosphoserine phosphatase)